MIVLLLPGIKIKCNVTRTIIFTSICTKQLITKINIIYYNTSDRIKIIRDFTNS